MQITPDTVFAHSEDVVARDIHGELILIPVASGIGELDEDIYSLNETGKAIWDTLDGKKTLKSIAEQLCNDFQASQEDITQDVLGLIRELAKRKMIRKL